MQGEALWLSLHGLQTPREGSRGMGDGSRVVRGVHRGAPLSAADLPADVPGETPPAPPSERQDEGELFVWPIEVEVRAAEHVTSRVAI